MQMTMLEQLLKDSLTGTDTAYADVTLKGAHRLNIGDTGSQSEKGQGRLSC
jgi:hypothetical protein